MTRPSFLTLHTRLVTLAALCTLAALAWWPHRAHAPGVAVRPGPLTGEVIMLDPGHGGIDGGCGAGGVLEKEINLRVARLVRDTLSELGASVPMTRDRDVALDGLFPGPKTRHARDLHNRVQLARQEGATLFVSLHVNASSDPNASGVFGYYDADNREGQRLANVIVKELAAVVGGPSRRVYPARFYVLRAQSIPSALIEMGFITNAKERQVLTSAEGQQKIARAIAKGIEAFITNPETGLPLKPSLSEGPFEVHVACAA